MTQRIGQYILPDMENKYMVNNSCSEIMGQWRFSKDVINKMNQMASKTTTIEYGGVLCGSIEGIRKNKPIIDIITECRGNECDMHLDSKKECAKQKSVPKGTFHTHPDREVTLPSIRDLVAISPSANIMCIGTSKAKEDRIMCFKSKPLITEEDINRRKKLIGAYRLEAKLTDIYRLEPKIITTEEWKNRMEEYNNVRNDILKYYYKFDPSKCME